MVALAYQHEEEHSATLQEYWEVERNSDIKHEYINGCIVAMAGASTNHNRITRNISGQLYNQLRGQSCEPFAQDLRVRIPGGNYVYPDVIVACPPLEWDDELPDTLTNPRVIIEVLSPSTAALDRGDKFNDYIRLASLTDYILVSQDHRRMEHYQRRDNGNWLYHMVEAEDNETDAAMTLEAIDCRLMLTEVYERVEFSQAQPADPSAVPTENGRAS